MNSLPLRFQLGSSRACLLIVKALLTVDKEKSNGEECSSAGCISKYSY